MIGLTDKSEKSNRVTRDLNRSAHLLIQNSETNILQMGQNLIRCCHTGTHTARTAHNTNDTPSCHSIRDKSFQVFPGTQGVSVAKTYFI